MKQRFKAIMLSLLTTSFLLGAVSIGAVSTVASAQTTQLAVASDPKPPGPRPLPDPPLPKPLPCPGPPAPPPPIEPKPK